MSIRNALLVALLGLASCGGPPPVPPTLVAVTITTAAEANDGAPVAVRVYQLVSPAAFSAAEFFPLFNTDTAALKDDVVKRDDLLLAPGTTRSISLSPPDRASSLGVFAAFKEYGAVVWHVVVPIPAHATSTVLVGIGKTGITTKVEAGKP